MTHGTLTREPYGTTADGTPVELFSCQNSLGMILRLTSFGACVVSLETPDRNGVSRNITLSHPHLSGWMDNPAYFGATVGRFCNRIANGQFQLGDRTYTLATNNGPHHLHGGTVGFNKKVWTAEPYQTSDETGVVFGYLSPEGEEGYPGNLRVEARYTLSDRGEFRVEFSATTDQPTPINLTNHNYWNLAGQGKVLDHQLTLHADRYLEVDPGLIPTGRFLDVQDSPFDFRQPKTIGSRIRQIDAEPQGYDHCYVLNAEGDLTVPAAEVYEPVSGRRMVVATTQPGLQLYTGNFLGGDSRDAGFNQYEGFCLETQHYPDSPNQPLFPDVILRPGEVFRQVTTHTFSVEMQPSV